MADYSFYIVTTYAFSAAALIGLALLSYRNMKLAQRGAQKLRQMRKERS